MGLDMYLYKGKQEFDGQLEYDFNNEIGYWRKANQIHKWFVDNVQDGQDECEDHVVTKEKAEELLNICNQVLNGSKLEKGLVQNGQLYKDGQWIPNFEEGEIIKDVSIAEKLLPVSSGFFFGGTDYDQWYFEDVKLTREILEKALKETDFENGEVLIYGSSW